MKYAEKDEAKAAGARWDPEEKKWYIPANMDSKRFRWPQIAGAGSSSVDGRKSKKPGVKSHANRKKSLGYKLDRLQREFDDRLDHVLAKDD
ncbi:DUF5710 domain-containing protein [Massilia soli]|uniref:DUF5710 domain-containing protein n=1 Tax=Massilia soli TaxID=2792854 RepID=A0ABS7STQ7_9BURK|nr:DUF5710 domain-containing protein [Massilia soli]